MEDAEGTAGDARGQASFELTSNEQATVSALVTETGWLDKGSH